MKIIPIDVRSITLGALIILLSTSCTKELDRRPTNGITNDIQYSSVAGYKQSLGSLYATFVFGGAGPWAENYFLRRYFNLQEGTTDEVILTWDDPQYNQLSWTADQENIGAFYSTLMSNITLCNNFIMESSAEKVAERGLLGGDAETIQQYLAEAKFLRAYFYYILMDLYGNPPHATERELLTGEAPMQIMRADLFDFIETELTAIEPLLPEPRSNEYGRADKAACWSLLARMYLNASVYTNTERYTDAITFCDKVIGAGYALVSHNNWLMLADNERNTDEFIFTINSTNSHQQTTWGSTNYIILGAAGVDAATGGLNGSWDMFRIPSSFVSLFPTADTTVDKRATFWKSTQTLEIDNIPDPRQGYSSFKFRNVNRDGSIPDQNNTYGNLSDVDFPLFRLAEIYLIYAESVLRGGVGGDLTTALSYINQLRGRAYANDPKSALGNISPDEFNLDFLLDERARELFWECHRRTDLIRYNRFTTRDYLWEWKGGVKAGVAVDEKYNLFPIPTFDLLANSNLDQNNGY